MEKELRYIFFLLHSRYDIHEITERHVLEVEHDPRIEFVPHNYANRFAYDYHSNEGHDRPDEKMGGYQFNNGVTFIEVHHAYEISKDIYRLFLQLDVKREPFNEKFINVQINYNETASH